MEDYLPDAQVPLNDMSDAAVPAPSDVDGAPPSGGLSKAERDRLAQIGRQNADAQRRAAAAEQRALRAEQLATSVVQREQQRDQQARDSYLRSLPAPQREQEIMRLRVADLERQVNTPPPVRTVQQEPSQDEIRRQAQAILQQVNQEYGVQLNGSEEEIDWGGAAEFRASARALASAHRRLGTQQEGDDMQDRTERPRQSAGRPVSATPTGGARAPVSMEDYQRVQWGYNSKQGPQSIKQKQQAIFERAATRVPR